MPRYVAKVKVTKTYLREVEVMAQSPEEAWRKAEQSPVVISERNLQEVEIATDDVYECVPRGMQ